MIPYRIRLAFARITATVRDFRRIQSLADWDDHRVRPKRRKGQIHRLTDLVYISLRWGEVSSLYYAQGLDEVGTSVARIYLAYPVFRSLRNAENRRPGAGGAFDYVCLLQDKLLFDRYFRAGDISVVPVLGQIFPSLRCEYAGRHYETISSLAARLEEGTDLFCKPRTGIKGAHVFKLGIRQGTLLINGEPVDESEIGVFVREAYVCQTRIGQHPDLGRFHEDSLNTLRVITWRVGNHIEVFGCYLRMGASGAITDNDTQARAVVRVDPETGDLDTHGYATFGDSVYETAHHPTTMTLPGLIGHVHAASFPKAAGG